MDLMQATFDVSSTLKCSTFETMEQDVDEMIMIINFCLRLGEVIPEKTNSQPRSNGDVKRIKVNDKTASGGWF